MSQVEKRCCVCGDDVANKKRVKDPKGHYFCDPCYQQKRAAAKAAVAAPVAVGGDGLPAMPDLGALDLAPTAAAPADDGLMDLAPVEKPARSQENMFGCSSCKKLVPERQIKNLDGEFVCSACAAKRGASSRSAPRPRAGQEKHEHDEIREGWSDSLTGGMVISACILAAAFGIFFVLNMMWPESTFFTGVGAALVMAVVNTVFLVFRTIGLMLSMLVAARILGGISFGYIGSALYKSLGLLTGFSVLEICMAHSESFGMMGIGFKGILLVIGFVVVFKIDYFEAMLLSVVNFFLNIGLGIGMVIVAMSVAGWLSGHHSAMDDDEEFQPRMKHVAPDAPKLKEPVEEGDKPAAEDAKPAAEEKQADKPVMEEKPAAAPGE